MEIEVGSTNISVFNKLESNLNEMKKKYEVVPDATDTEGFNALKANLKEYSRMKKEVEETRLAERRKLTEIGKAFNVQAEDIMKVVEEVFGPHKKAKEAEDKRKKEVAEKKKREKEIRLQEIRTKIDVIRETYVKAIDFTSIEVKKQIDLFKEIPVTFEVFDDHIDEAEEVYESTLKKLSQLYESKKQQELSQAELDMQRKELQEAKEKQRLEDEKRAADQKAKDEADRQAVEADKKKLEEEKAAFQAEVEHMRAEKKKMEEQEARLRDEGVARIAKELEDECLKKEAEAKVLKEAEEKKQRLEAAKLAEKERDKRYQELFNCLSEYFDTNYETKAFLEDVKENKISYLRIDWTEK